MTSLQLLLSIGIPSVLVLLGWFQTNSRLGRVETGLDKVDARFDRLAGELVRLRSDVNRDMTALRKDLNSDMAALRNDLSRKMISLRDSIHRDMVTLHERVAVVEARNG